MEVKEEIEMKLRRLAHGALVSGVVLFGCENGDIGEVTRHTGEVVVNGTPYASNDVNDAYAGGIESSGLAENPMKRPSSSVLGEPGLYRSMELTSEPSSYEGFVNEIIEITVTAKGVKPNESEDAPATPAPGARVVIRLERPEGTNGALSIDSGVLADKTKYPPSDTEIVAKTDASGQVTFRVHTGSYYNDTTPMYYVNVWHADAESPAVTDISVRKIPRKSDLHQGDGSTSNDLTPPSDLEGKKGTDGAEMEALDELEQVIYSTATKRYRVLLKKDSDLLVEEDVCWTLVGKSDVNDGYVIRSTSAGVDRTTTSGCGKTGSDGVFWVDFYAGEGYGARYYVNFFHVTAQPPVSYQIDTTYMPDTLGSLGNGPGGDLDGDGEPDAVIPGITVDYEDGAAVIKGGEACELLSKIVTEGSDLYKVITEVCGDISSADACSDSFSCKVEQNPDGTWSVIHVNEDGTEEPIKADVNGDCKVPEEDKASCPGEGCSGTYTCFEKDKCLWVLDGGFYQCTDQKCSCMDDVRLSISYGDDGLIYEGIDTDGDGKPDVAPDPCKFSDDESCKEPKTFEIVWSKENAGFYAQKKMSTPIDEVFNFYLRKRGTKDGSGVSGQTLRAKIIRGSYASNDAMFDSKEGPEEAEYTTGVAGKVEVNFWSGTAYDALYYLNVSSENAATVLVPISTTQSLSLPGGKGDEGDRKEAEEPPADIGTYDEGLGECAMVIDPEWVSNTKGEAQVTESLEALRAMSNERELTSPIVKTLTPKVAVICQNGSTTKMSYAANTKTYWKVTRGSSSYNNATLMSSVNVTDENGVASADFFTGTGYGSVYYVSIFHPNVKEGSKLKPSIYKITVTKTGGVVEGVDPSEDPELPEGESKDGDDYCCSDKCSSCIEGQTPDCSNLADYSSENTYKYCTAADVVNGITTNKELPQRRCQSAEYVEFEEDGVTLKIPYDEDAEDLSQYNCLWLSFDERSPLTLVQGATVTLKASLMWRNGEEIIPVRDYLYWTVNKNAEANGKLLAEKSRTKSTGIGTTMFYAGDQVTTYKVNVMHPNLHEMGNMVPESIMVNVIDKSQVETVIADSYKMNLSTTNEDGTVVYYVMSGMDNARCDSSFVLQSKSEIQSACEEAASPSSWEKESNASVKSAMCGVTEIPVDVIDDGPYIVYAIQYDGSRPKKYGCMSGLYMPTPGYFDEEGNSTYTACTEATKACKQCEKNHPTDYADTCYNEESVDAEGPDCLLKSSENGPCKKTSILNVEIPLDVIPDYLNNSYQIDTVFDLGPLVELPEPGCTDKTVGCTIRKIIDTYQQFLQEDPGGKIIEELTKNLVFDKESEVDKTNTEAIQNCMRMFKCTDKNGSVYTDLKNACSVEWNNVTGPCECTEESGCKNVIASSIADYKGCDCFCGKLFYWTQKSDATEANCSRQHNKLAPTVIALVKPLLKNLINRALNTQALEDMVCGFVDSIQFVRFKGNVTFDAAGNTGILNGMVNFNSVTIPVANVTLDLGSKGTDIQVISGRFSNGEQDLMSITIPNLGLNFSYGMLIYGMISKMLPEGAVDENGQVQFSNLIKCSSFFGSGINIPFVGSIGAEILDTLCAKALEPFSDKVFSIADSQYVSLGLSLSGSVDTDRGDTCVKYENGCRIENLKNGIWTGSGSMRGVTKSIDGLWSGVASGTSYPELTYGSKTIDEFMAERSVCRQAMATTVNNKDLDYTNSSCLGVPYDNFSSRPLTHKCAEKKCKGTAIVVCKDGEFNTDYAKATGAEIIKAANEACANVPADDSCNESPEIINGGKGITNAECIANKCAGACSDPKKPNDSIIVCVDGSLSQEMVDEKCTYLEVSKKYDCTGAAIEACTGNCSSPGCLMNSEVTSCTEGGEVVPPTAKLVASWDFRDYKANTEFTKALSTGIAGGLDEEKTGDYTVKSTANGVKLVTGSDSELGAIGLTDGEVTIAGPDGIEITKVVFKVFGAGRVLHYGEESLTTEESIWQTVVAEATEGTSFGNNFVISFDADEGISKLSRVDDIQVFAR